MDANGNAMFTTKERAGYAPLKASGFSVWRWAGKAEAEADLDDKEALVVDTYGRKFFATPPVRIPEQWAVYKDAESKTPSKIFEDEDEARGFAAEGGYERVERRPPKDISNLFEKQQLYAPRPIADMINKMTATDNLFRSTPVLGAIGRLNTSLKTWILLSSFFHHLAGTRSWVFGVHHGWKKVNPVRAYKDGLKKIEDLNPILESGIKNGLTLGELQDWAEQELRETKGLSERLVNYLGLEKTAKAMEYGRFRRERFTDSLFKKFFAGLKAEAFVMEYTHELQKENEKYTRGRVKVAPNPDEIAERVARLINADFGGLHLKRMGRNPTLQKVARLLLLAPDWCAISDTRAMTKTGWKYYYELAVGKDEILAFNQDSRKFEWSLLKDMYVNEEYSGKMIKVKNYTRSVMMTPDHTCYVYNKQNKEYGVIKARDLNSRHQIPRCAEFHQFPIEKTFSDFFVQLVGWLRTDGYIATNSWKLKNGLTNTGYYGWISQCKPDTVKVLKDLGLKYREIGFANKKIKQNYSEYAFKIPQKEFEKMRELGIAKKLNWKFLSKLTKDQLKLLYHTIWLADGCDKDKKIISGSDAKIFDAVMINTLLGRPVTFRKQTPTCGTALWVTKGDKIGCWKSSESQIREVNYTGPIWCPSVDTGFWLAEREGLMFITGNTESNFRTVTGMIPGLNQHINKLIGDVPPPKGMEDIYRRFWGRVMLRIAVSTILAQMLLNGADDTEEFLKEQALSNRWNKLRWTEIDITRLYNMLGIDTEGQRKTFSLGGHFFDPLKLVDPFRLAKGKASPIMRVAGALFTGSDWADRPFTGTREFVKTGKTVKKSVHQEKEAGVDRLPALVVNQVVNMQPIQVGHFIRYMQGEEDGLTALAHSMGAATHTAWPPRIETP
ncbi:MAG: hypothetical protein KKB31_07300, partial [Nanoarchaeota archaeon]|nr:hypothetical protein [Nanoarchaeota archaeon]